MQAKATTLSWMGSAFAAAALLSAVVWAIFGIGKPGTIIALQLTARFSFLLFWLAYAGGGLAVLLGPAAQSLQRHGRDFGLAFAAAHLVHLGLVAWLCWIGAAPNMDVFIFFGPPAAIIYILALFSIGSWHQVLGRTLWRLLRTAGMTYIAYGFAADFLSSPLSGDAKRVIMYAPFAFLNVIAPVLHVISLLPFPRRAPS